MSDDFEWLVEHETLPPDDLPADDPPSADSSGRRLPRWIWLLGVVAIVVASALIWLWSLGSKIEPLPNPDPPQTRLEAIVQMEIDAMLNGDQEIFAQVQDYKSRRVQLQPPPEAWFSGLDSGTGSILLLDIQTIEDDTAWAKVSISWQGKRYILHWYYRQVDDRWVHTDWVTPPMGAEETLTLPHLKMIYHQSEQEQAAPLIGRLEAMIQRLCQLRSCLAEPFTATVTFDTRYTYYNADPEPGASLGTYRIPSPLRIRWPEHDEPEPLILASLGRQLAYAITVGEKAEGLAAENKAALILATFWLAHHLLELEPLPTTLWLDEAAQMDGIEAAAAYIDLLAEGLRPHDALRAFSPRAIAAATTSPDYFGWASVVMDTDTEPGPPHFPTQLPPPWDRPLEFRFDWEIDPWATDGNIYDTAAPVMEVVEFLDGWALAMTEGGSLWGSVHFFRQQDDVWIPALPDETLVGEQRTKEKGPIEAIYWAWDEPYIDDILTRLDDIYNQIATNFSLDSDDQFSILFAPYPGFEYQSWTYREIELISPTLTQLLHREEADQLAQVAWAMVLTPIMDRYSPLPIDGGLLLIGVALWQIAQFDLDVIQYLGEDLVQQVGNWRPPNTVEATTWEPLENMWSYPQRMIITEEVIYSTLLIEYLVASLGRDQLPLMLDAVESADSVDEWLQAVSGRALTEFEPGWRQWVIDLYSD